MLVSAMQTIVTGLDERRAFYRCISTLRSPREDKLNVVLLQSRLVARANWLPCDIWAALLSIFVVTFEP